MLHLALLTRDVRQLLHLLEVYVGDVVVVTRVVGGAGISACVCLGLLSLLGLSLSVVDVLLCGLESVFDFLDGCVTGGYVLTLVSVFQFGEGAFDSSLLVGGNLVTEVAEALLGLEDDGIGLIELVDAFLLFGIGIGVCGSFVLHTLDFGVCQAAGSFDTYALLFTGGFVLGGNVEYTVGIDFESNFDLRYAARCGSDAVEVEFTDKFVVFGHGAFALQDVDFDGRLVVGSGGEYLALASRYCGVGVDEFGHHAAEGLKAYAQRHYIEQQYVLDIAAEYTALYGSAYGYDFIGIDALVGSLAKELFDNLLYGRYTCRTTYENNFVDVVGRHSGVLECLTAGAEGGVDEAVGQLLEFGTCQCLNEVFGHSVYGHDVRQIDFGAGGAGQLDFGLFGGFFEALQCHRILTKVYAFVFLKFVGQPVDDYVVKVIAAQVGVAVGGFNFEYAVTQFEDGYIECAAAEVEYGNF